MNLNLPCKGEKCYYLASTKQIIHADDDKKCVCREVSNKNSSLLSFGDVIRLLIHHLGEDLHREGLDKTPERVTRAWVHWTSGYNQDPQSIFKHFKDGANGYDEMVSVRNVPFYSHCEHHLAPFFGTATVAYVPDGKVIGLSKLVRLIEIFSLRLQVQERLTCEIADTLFDGTKEFSPKGVGVVVRARHLCMESRGVQKQGSETVTSALRGVLFKDPRARSEFLSLAGIK